MADGTGNEIFIFISAEKCERTNSKWISRENEMKLKGTRDRDSHSDS